MTKREEEVFRAAYTIRTYCDFIICTRCPFFNSKEMCMFAIKDLYPCLWDIENIKRRFEDHD